MSEKFNRVMKRVTKRFAHQRSILLKAESDDHRLRWLWARCNEVGCDVNDVGLPDIAELVQSNTRNDLEVVVAFTLAWLAEAGVVHGDNKVSQERERQRQLFRARRISFDVANAIIDPGRKFRVLAEEVGEVAHALDQIENHGMARGNLHLELIQVAAVAVAWLESFEVQS